MALNTLNEIQKLWSRTLEDLKKKISDVKVYDAFFKTAYIYSIEGNKLVLACDSKFALTILKQYADFIKESIDKESGSDFQIIITTQEEIESKPKEKIIEERPVFFKSSIVDPNYTFDNFVVGLSNKEASQAGLIVSANPGDLYNPLFIFGGSGLGKTHLLNAIGNHIKETKPLKKILCITAQDFLYQYLEYVNNSQKNEDLAGFIKNFDVLLLDDIQMLNDKKKTLEFFFDIYQYFLQNKKLIVLTSDRLPSELTGIDARLVSRFMDGLTVQITQPNSQMCEDILKKKIVGAGLSLDEFDNDVISFVADKFKSTVRDLNGALNRIIFIKNLRHADHIDLDLASEALSSILNVSNGKKTVNEYKILNTVASYYNLSVPQITGKLKTGQIALARHIAIYLIRQQLDLPLKKIGGLFSNRDHTTIMHSVSKVDELLKTNEQYKIAINEIKKRLNG